MKKLNNKKGFTLMEMLIVVAIIAILVAIAIPTMSNSLLASKQAADNANVRAAYSEAMNDYLLNGSTNDNGEGKSEAVKVQANYDGTTDIAGIEGINWNANEYVTVTVSKSGVATISTSGSNQ